MVVLTLQVADIVAVVDSFDLFGELSEGLDRPVILRQRQAQLTHRVVGLEAREYEGIIVQRVTHDLWCGVTDVVQ